MGFQHPLPHDEHRLDAFLRDVDVRRAAALDELDERLEDLPASLYPSHPPAPAPADTDRITAAALAGPSIGALEGWRDDRAARHHARETARKRRERRVELTVEVLAAAALAVLLLAWLGLI